MVIWELNMHQKVWGVSHGLARITGRVGQTDRREVERCISDQANKESEVFHCYK